MQVHDSRVEIGITGGQRHLVRDETRLVDECSTAIVTAVVSRGIHQWNLDAIASEIPGVEL
jgi:hypothetical protein